MSSPRELFLRRGGQTFGPFTDQQIDAMRASGELLDYAWIWNPQTSQWAALDKPPAPPSTNSVPVAKNPPPFVEPEAPAERARQRAPEPEAERPRERAEKAPAIRAASGFSALAYNHASVINGTLDELTPYGCNLIWDGHNSPPFGAGSTILINLLEEKSGKSMSFRASLAGIQRRDGQWVLKLQWQDCPELLRKSA